MEFKGGDRVHVMMLGGKEVDFYGTLSEEPTNSLSFKLKNCSNSIYEGEPVWDMLIKNSCDYYTLATDEEDTEEPVIQRINDMYNDVPTHYKADIDVIEFCRQHFTDEEFKGAMKFNLIKYPTRLGRKDDMVKELDKIIDYAQRYKEVLENGTT